MAYAAVTSLMGTLHLHFLQSQPRFPLEDKQRIVSLQENLGFLQEILEESETAYDYSVMKDLEAEIREVSLEAEESIEMELSTIYVAKGWTKRVRITVCQRMLHKIFNEAVKQTDYLKNELIRIKSECQLAKGSGSSQNEIVNDVSSSSQPDLDREENVTASKFSKNASKFDSRMVGCHEEFMMILDQLTRQSYKQLQVVSIVGMGGMGKTTLARKVYEDPSITCHFDKRAWITVSQDSDMLQMLRGLSGCVVAVSTDEQSNEQSNKERNELHEQSNEPREQNNELSEQEKEKKRKEKERTQLAENVYKCLKGQRYLIVIDDIWSTTTWDSVQRIFPDDNNGSRILLTSRLKEVAEYASSGNSPLNLPFLDADESWNLYCKVFGKTEFPFEFDRIGRDIVKKCEGLPLAIIVVASLLSKTEEDVNKWKNVARNVSRFVIDDSSEACSRILSLSYNQLPQHLKPCFLYFGVFPEDYEISAKKLVKLWAAEGFLRAVKHQNPEEVATECLQDLVDRSLVIVSKQSYNGKIKTIRIHDLLRDLCLREAQREKLRIDEMKSQHSSSEPSHWISIRPGSFNNLMRSKCIHKLHSLHFYESFANTRFSIKEISKFKLLRVVDVELDFWNGGNVPENLVHLRYFALCTKKCFDYFHVNLFEHWNMQSFIVRGCGVLESSQASAIWKMPLLRNFYFDRILSLETSEVVHRNLETISWLTPKCCTKNLFKRILNLKKLGIMGRGSHNCFYSFVQLDQLEKLSIRWWDLKSIPCSGIPWETSFLPNLKKLSFIETKVPWSDMSLIGMLPNLEVLKLIDACEGQKWELSEGGFRQLKRLVIAKTSMDCWEAVGEHFPVLERLELQKCYSLQEIPSCFADITTLALIQLHDCSDSLLASAECIQDEQQSYGIDALLIRSENIWKRKRQDYLERN